MSHDNLYVTLYVTQTEFAILNNDYYGQQTLVILYDTSGLIQDMRGYGRAVRRSPAPLIIKPLIIKGFLKYSTIKYFE